MIMVGAETRTPEARLRGHADFRKIWAGLTISLMGSQGTSLALPLAAVLTLGSGPLEMGLLAAASQAPFLCFSLLAGVWSDRVRRRPVLIATDLGQAALLGSIPLAAALGVLRLEQLYLVAFLTGTLQVFYEVAHYAYVPAVVGREQIVTANSRIQVSYSAAESGGPGMAGVLVQWLSAPIAIFVDAFSFLVSAFCVRSIRAPEAPPTPPRTSVRSQIAEGMRGLIGHPLLQPIVLVGVASGLFTSAIVAVYVLYATRTLHLAPAVIGIIFAAGGVAAIPGALLASWVAARVGVGPAIVGGWFVEMGALLLIPLAAGPAVIPILVASKLIAGASGTVANIHQWSLRQVVTPDHLLGRVTASHRFIVYGIQAVGGLLGGGLATMLGLRAAIAVCAVGATLGPLWALASPLRRLREQPIRA